MTWLKGSDSATNNPIVLAPLAWQPDPGWPADGGNLHLMLYGLVQKCATISAQQGTDYVVEDGVVAGAAHSPDWRVLADLAARAGYWDRLEDDTGYLLVDDSEHLFHIRLQSEIRWERDRKSDIANPNWTVPVRLRDGDGCRFCANIVNWKDRYGRGGTYDHRVPGQRAETVDDLRVACKMCNSKRGGNPDALELLPPPLAPYYGAETVAFLAKHGINVPLSTGTQRPLTQRDPAHSDPASSGTTLPTATPPPAGPRAPRPRTQRDPAQSTQETSTTAATGRPHRAARPVKPATDTVPEQPKRISVKPAETRATEVRAPGRVGTGRDATVRVPDPPPDPSTDPTSTGPRRWRRRARRGRPEHNPGEHRD